MFGAAHRKSTVRDILQSAAGREKVRIFTKKEVQIPMRVNIAEAGKRSKEESRHRTGP
jgi:hypothetical protein